MFQRWHEAACTLAKLHRIEPASVRLSNFGRPSGFYERQIKSLSKVSRSQAETADVDTTKIVGQIPHFDEIVAFFSDPAAQPRDRSTLVHGDFKIDILVYHKTEPRIIGILECVRPILAPLWLLRIVLY